MKKIAYFIFLILVLSTNIYAQQNWVLVMNQKTGYNDQIWRVRNHFPTAEIQEFWNLGYAVTHLTYSDEKWALVMSKGSNLGLQYWTAEEKFPEKNVNDFWGKGYHITNVTYGNGQWAVVMSNNMGLEDQIWDMSENYPQETIQQYWDKGYRISCLDHGQDGWIVVMNKGGKVQEQVWKTRKEYPKAEIEEFWNKGYSIHQLTYGQGVWGLVMSKGLGWGIQKWQTKTTFPDTEITDNWAKGWFVTGIYHGDIASSKPNNPNNPVVPKPEIVYTKPSVNWNAPYTAELNVNKQEYRLRACVKSTSAISEIKVLVNGVLQNEARGFDVVPDDGCDNTIDKTIQLNAGSNKLQLQITNKGGTTFSEIRDVIFEEVNENPEPVNNNTTQKKIALLIGNAAYASSPLTNPINDVRSMETSLQGLGFEVMKIENASQKDMKKGIDDYGNKLKAGKYDVALFFYAGHGLQIKGNNFIMPVDATIKQEQDVEYECVEAGRILAKMEGSDTKVNIIIMDACRDNPFEKSWSRSTKGNGLAMMDAPVGSIVCYATSPGKTASDGSGTNGLYTEQLLKFMQVPNLSIEEVFKQVRIAVVQKSNKQQVPWETSSLVGDFFFKK